jgi:hypothetical protein
MTGCPSKLVPIGFELPLGGFLKIHRPLRHTYHFPSYFPLIHPISLVQALGWPIIQGLHLALWEEGAKGPEGKSKLEKDKILKIKPRDASPRDPRHHDPTFSFP